MKFTCWQVAAAILHFEHHAHYDQLAHSVHKLGICQLSGESINRTLHTRMSERLNIMFSQMGAGDFCLSSRFKIKDHRIVFEIATQHLLGQYIDEYRDCISKLSRPEPDRDSFSYLGWPEGRKEHKRRCEWLHKAFSELASFHDLAIETEAAEASATRNN